MDEVRSTSKWNTLNLSFVQCKMWCISVKYLPFNCVYVCCCFGVSIVRFIECCLFTQFMLLSLRVCECVSFFSVVQNTLTPTPTTISSTKIRFCLQLCFFHAFTLTNSAPNGNNRTNGIKSNCRAKKKRNKVHTTKPFLRNLKQSIKFIECAYKHLAVFLCRWFDSVPAALCEHKKFIIMCNNWKRAWI